VPVTVYSGENVESTTFYLEACQTTQFVASEIKKEGVFPFRAVLLMTDGSSRSVDGDLAITMVRGELTEDVLDGDACAAGVTPEAV
jgi:hypothetical protein